MKVFLSLAVGGEHVGREEVTDLCLDLCEVWLCCKSRYTYICIFLSHILNYLLKIVQYSAR